MKDKNKLRAVDANGNLFNVSFPDQMAGNKNGSDIWQLCPKCQGNKQVYVNDFLQCHSTTIGSVGYEDCNICNGKGIISKVTGLPPKG